MKRREFLASALAALARVARGAPRARVTRVETYYWVSRDDAPFWPHWVWLRLHTDTGHVGLGETYPYGEVEASLIHTQAARTLLNADPRDVERIWADLYHTFDYRVSGGAEMRVLSAIDLALWDLLGNLLETPVYRLLGGKSNPSVRLYNTCFPLRWDFQKEPEKIMAEVLERYGIRAIKIWPFDPIARRNRRQFITPEDIEEALIPVRRLRRDLRRQDRDPA
jgi:galactonate dehydratase